MNKKTFLFLLVLFCAVSLSAQFSEDFSDGNFTSNPTWTGNADAFKVNAALELQSSDEDISVAYLTTPSQSMNNAVWECDVKINNGTSSANYASIYLAADTPTLDDSKAYYVQIGNTADEVSLYYQDGTQKTKIIDGTDKMLAEKTDIRIRVTRSANGEFALYHRKKADSDFTHEGSVIHTELTHSNYFGLLCKKSKSYAENYFFDNILVTGERAIDSIAPYIVNAAIVDSTQLEITFSEEIDLTDADFILSANGEEIRIDSFLLSLNQKSVIIIPSVEFENNVLYQVEAINVKDIAGNYLDLNNSITVGVPTTLGLGDVAFNEVLFENAEDAFEYVEIANLTGKLIDMSGLRVATRNSDGEFSKGSVFPESLLLPHAQIALCENAEIVKIYHNAPVHANVVNADWASLNNDKNTLYLVSADYEIIFDSMRYDSKWHHPIIKNEKGVALEKINPSFNSMSRNSWHSASVDVNYGTPGYANSQLNLPDTESKIADYVRLDPEAFSPDGDGFEDVCFIHYEMPDHGFVANVSVYTPSGLLLSQIADNAVLATKGYLTWNGTTKTGKCANVGVYVLLFEAFNTASGEVIKRKMPIVVSGR